MGVAEGFMKTKSEQLFETFLTANNVQFEKIEEIKERGAYRPDYLVTLGNLQFVFELKELAEDDNFGVVDDPTTSHTSRAIPALLATTFGAESTAQKNKSSTEPTKASHRSCLSITTWTRCSKCSAPRRWISPPRCTVN